MELLTWILTQSERDQVPSQAFPQAVSSKNRNLLIQLLNARRSMNQRMCQWTPSSLPRRSCRLPDLYWRQRPKDFAKSSDPHFRYSIKSKESQLRTSRLDKHIGSCSSSRSTGESDAASQLVVRVLDNIEDTDRGADASEELQTEVQTLLEKLENIGEAQVPRPLENPLIFGNYEVAYVSTKNAPKQDGQPAGGRFRSRLGRLLFRTEKVCQSVIQPDIVTNKVEFSLFGVLPGHVGLRGKLQESGGNKDTVKVFFEKPELCVAGLSLRIGPDSSVVLKTSYLDEAVRLGKGSRGSSFVFVRGGEADAAGMEDVGKSDTKWWGIAWVAGALVALWWAAASLLKVQCGRMKLLGPVAGILFAMSVAGAWNDRRAAQVTVHQ